MKKLLICLCSSFALSALAGTTSILGNLVPVNGTPGAPCTSNSLFIAIGTLNVPRGQFQIANGGLANTNDFKLYEQISLDGTNAINVAIYQASATNATTETFIPTNSVITIYMRVQVVSTNSINLGGSFTQ